jgi:hypothetical protein
MSFHRPTRQAIIKLETSLVMKDLPKAKLTQAYEGGSTEKIEVSICDGSSFEGVLLTIRDFLEAATTLSFDDEEKFLGFRKCVSGSAKEDWDNVSAGYEDQTQLSFNDYITRFKRVFMTNETKQNLIDYILQLNKPRSMEVRVFARRVRTLNCYAAELPDDNGASVPTLTESQLKNVIFRAMPEAWQRQFLRANQHLARTTLQNLIEYMDTEKSFADVANPKQASNQERDDKKNNNGTHHKKKRSNHNDGSNSKRFRSGNGNETCPIHPQGKHTWDQCFQNQYGSSFKPRGTINWQGGRGSGRGGRGGRGQGNFNGAGRFQGRGTQNGHTGRDTTPVISNRSGGYTGPTNQAFFQNGYENYVHEHAPIGVNQTPTNYHPGVAGRTQTYGGAQGWNMGNSRGASPTAGMLPGPGGRY